MFGEANGEGGIEAEAGSFAGVENLDGGGEVSGFGAGCEQAAQVGERGIERDRAGDERERGEF